MQGMMTRSQIKSDELTKYHDTMRQGRAIEQECVVQLSKNLRRNASQRAHTHLLHVSVHNTGFLRVHVA
jgi:hypothetical protein